MTLREKKKKETKEERFNIPSSKLAPLPTYLSLSCELYIEEFNF